MPGFPTRGEDKFGALGQRGGRSEQVFPFAFLGKGKRKDLPPSFAILAAETSYYCGRLICIPIFINIRQGFTHVVHSSL